jgi:Protein of unknown function (DUF3093)
MRSDRSERSDEDPVVFFERLWPSPGIWTATVAFGAALGLIPAPINVTVAVVVSIVGIVSFITLLVLTTPILVLTQSHFAAGRARLPVGLLSGVEVLDSEQMRQARGVGLDARAYLCIRPWLPIGARVILNDPEDPTPYWLVSSRRPEALAAAVSAGIARNQPQD